ncbi:hypothetical protein [Rhodoplanes sp. SY1]|uniref:hypothetical protein n=1 Tax=Rhodoplanes sp. SY1 TaxID=3166646 RepID=UPI0038B55B0E
MVVSRCAIPKPTPNSPLKVEPRTCQVVLPGPDGIGGLAVATAAATPRRASRWLSATWVCRPASCDWKPVAKLVS